MNQLFNPVNYFEFQAFEVFRRRSIPPSYFSYRSWKQKAAEAFLRAAAFG
jgi:hypothetical protein